MYWEFLCAILCNLNTYNYPKTPHEDNEEIKKNAWDSRGSLYSIHILCVPCSFPSEGPSGLVASHPHSTCCFQAGWASPPFRGMLPPGSPTETLSFPSFSSRWQVQKEQGWKVPTPKLPLGTEEPLLKWQALSNRKSQTRSQTNETQGFLKNSFFFKKVYLFMCMVFGMCIMYMAYGCFARTYICASRSCLVPVDIRRGCCILWNWSYREPWATILVLGTWPGSSEVPLTSEAALQPIKVFYKL